MHQRQLEPQAAVILLADPERLPPRSRFTKPDSRVYLTPAFHDLHGGNIKVQGPFNPYIPCSMAAQQPREYLLREPLVVDAPLTCVWCARACPLGAPRPISSTSWRACTSPAQHELQVTGRLTPMQHSLQGAAEVPWNWSFNRAPCT